MKQPLSHFQVIPFSYYFRMKMKKLLLYAIFSFSLQALYSQTVNVTSPGTFGVSCPEYVNNMNKIWSIDIPGSQTLTLSYQVSVETGYDKVFIYSIDNSGNASLQVMLTGTQTGEVNSLHSNGKMRVVFTTDHSVNCSTNPTYRGFEITVSRVANATGISYVYDTSGNRTIRRIIPPQQVSGAPAEGEEETVFSEKIGMDGFEAGIRIYPNPTEGRFAVEIGHIPDTIQGEIYLYDTQGKLLERKSLRSGNKVDFDLSRNQAGMYILDIRLGEKTSRWKIIKK